MASYFTIQELCKSATAQARGIDNTPTLEAKVNLQTLINKVLNPLREAYGKPIRVSSGYRCPRLNKAVGGVATSDHLKGLAADLNNGRSENIRIFELAKSMIKDGRLVVGQLINEKSGAWIHISAPTAKHRNQILNL